MRLERHIEIDDLNGETKVYLIKDIAGNIACYFSIKCGEGLKLIKPDYDNYCYGLVQEVKKLKENRESIWEEFSDIWN